MKKKGLYINCHCTGTLFLQDIDILIYDFQLRKRVTSHSKTIDIIKRLLAPKIVENWESTRASCKSIRLMIAKIFSALVDSTEVYGSSKSSSSDAKENSLDSYGVLEAMIPL